MHCWSTRALLVLAVVAALLGRSPLTASAGSTQDGGGLGIRLLDAPITARADPRAQVYIVDQLKPGTTITRHVQVTNSTATPVEATLYPAAASISGGQFHFAADQGANRLTSWTTVTPPTSTLAPGTSTDATVRIAIPPDAVRGEQYAVIWAQVASAPITGGQVRQVNRVGVRMYVDVSGSRQASSFTITGIVPGRDRSGRPQITARVRNTGQRAIDVSGAIGLTHGPGGLRAGGQPIDTVETIAAGGVQVVSASFDRQLPVGPWLVTVTLASGTVHNQATAFVTFAQSRTKATQIQRAVVSPAGPAWWLIAALIALVGLSLVVVALVAGLVLRTRRRRQPASLV